MLETRGAPRDQGRIQAQRLPTEIRDAVAALRGARGILRWRAELRAAQRSVGRSLARFTPQLHERLQGIAGHCDLPIRALVLAESALRFKAHALAKDGGIQARVAAPPGLEAMVRTTQPDAGGFASVELTCAPLASALAGVNSCGICIACLDCGPPGALPARVLVSDVLLRTQSFTTALEHVRRRAHYLHATGSLLLSGPSGDAARLELSAGRMRIEPSPVADCGAPNLELAGPSCSLRFEDGVSRVHTVSPPGPMPTG